MTQFINLHAQTDYSILDSLIPVKGLFERAKELNQPATAITDHGTLAATWEALKVSRETGVKLIIGCECYFVDDINKVDKFRHIILIAKNQIGYRNLLTINKKGYDNDVLISKRVYPVIDWNLLEKYSDGLICLTACGNGIVCQLLTNGKNDEAESTILRLKKIFGDNLGLEVQPNNMQRGANYITGKIDQAFLNRQLILLGKKHNIKVVPACNAHYLTKDQSDVHDAMLSIGSRQSIYSNFRLKYNVPQFYLKSADEIKLFFSRNFGEEYADSIIANTVYFSDLCEVPNWIEPKFSNPSGKELPIFPVEDASDYLEFVRWLEDKDFKHLEIDKSYLRFRCDKLFKSRIESDDKIYKERLIEELDVIEFHGFSSYMLIVADYIDWARANNILVGPGRGSCGGSLIAFIIGIHQSDPIKYDLIFARFHNKEKTSFPDIDVDFAPSGRVKIQKYLSQKYGEEHVAHVSNINTVTPKVYVRDIARACELGGSKQSAVEIGNLVADCIPSDIHSIDDAIAKIPLFSEYCNKYPEFIKYKYVSGKYRSLSTHAGGIVISGRPLTGLIPLRKDKEGSLAVEYDKDKSEENGLVKMDILGLSTLDVIGETINIIRQAGKSIPDIIPLDDKKTYDLISKGNTFCVFQFGTSGGTIDLCKRIKPKDINDLANINALARPSAKDIRNHFIDTRDGKRPMSLLHPNLARAFNGTLGFGLFEESLMFLAQDIAGWSLHSADRLRKLTKEKGKNPKKVKLWREEFINDSVKNNVNEEIAKRIWDEVIVNFSGYGFNKSHAILYSMISYQTAYLKANYPVEFLLANLKAEVNSSTPDSKPNIEKIKSEIRSYKINIIPPNINTSQLTYTLNGNDLLTGLDALKFVSDEAIAEILSKRPFVSFFDFMSRVDSKLVRSNAIQALAASGALDLFNLPRKSIFLYCSDYRKKLQVWLKRHNPKTEQFVYPWSNEEPWKKSELYALEEHYLGEGFICKAHEAYGEFFFDQHKTISDIKRVKDKTKLAPIKAFVRSFFECKVKKETSKYYGQSMIKAIIEDKNGDQCSCTIFPDMWSTVQQRIKMVSSKATFDVGLALNFMGSTNYYDDDIGIIVNDLYNVSVIPELPQDLKSKKINMKASKSDKATDKEIFDANPNYDGLFENIEDSLYDEGLIDFNDED